MSWYKIGVWFEYKFSNKQFKEAANLWRKEIESLLKNYDNHVVDTGAEFVSGDKMIGRGIVEEGNWTRKPKISLNLYSTDENYLKKFKISKDEKTENFRITYASTKPLKVR